MKTRIGKVTHFYNRISVAVLELERDLKVGDAILVLGHTTDLEQRVNSMEIEHQKVERAAAGGEVALHVLGPVRAGDEVFLVEGETRSTFEPG